MENTIKITNESREFTDVERYLMTMDNSIISMKDVEDGTSIPVDGYLEFTDSKKDGDVDIMSIITPDKKVYSMQSATFKKDVKNIAEIMHGKSFSVIKRSGTTNAGRPYITASLDISSVM